MATKHKTPNEEEIASTLGSIQLSRKVPQKPAHKPKSKPVADSWDDDSGGSDTETEVGVGTKPRDSLDPIAITTSSEPPPNPPPPTPASPMTFDFPSSMPYGGMDERRGSAAAARAPDRRPEKTTAVAGRLIAGALGVKAPKRTEEEKEYDRAMKEKEMKRRTEEKEKEKREFEETEARKKGVWDD